MEALKANSGSGGGERDEKPWDRNEKREKKRAPAVWVNQ